MELTRDAFLGGRVEVLQPKNGYRAAMDPVFLAAACLARAGETVLELGCGVGVATLCLNARVDGLRLYGVERQGAYADLARQNAEAAGARVEVFEADLEALPPTVKSVAFDHVIMNPPYYGAQAGTSADDSGREAALREATPLPAWFDCARRRLKPQGTLTLIQSADRLPECLVALQNGFGAVSVLPLQPRHGKAAKRVLVRAVKGRKSPFQLNAPFVIHAGSQHFEDGNDHTAEAEAVLREGAALTF